MFSRSVPLLLTAVLMTVLSGHAAAMSVYKVSSTSNINCGDDPHGLWTNKYNNTGCQEYFDFQDGSTLTVDEGAGTAVLAATAKNESGRVATINIEFGGMEEDYSPTKNGGGSTDPDWLFFTYVTSGQISFSNGSDGEPEFFPLLVGQTQQGVGGTGKPVFQVGTGANDKTADFGASGWFDIYGGIDGSGMGTDPRFVDAPNSTQHWDLNITLTAVPVPAAVWFFATALLGLAAFNSRKQR